MIADTLTTLFVAQPSSLLFYVLCVAGFLAILAVPSIIASPSGSDVGQVMAAVAMYALQLLGLVLLFAGAAPLLILLANGVLPGIEAMQFPVAMLVVGVWLLLHYGREVQSLTKDATAIPHALYATTVHLIGVSMILLGFFTAASSLLIAYTFGQWDSYLLLIFAGFALVILFPIPASTATKKKGIFSRRKK